MALLSAAVDQAFQLRSPFCVEDADTFERVELVPGETSEIDSEIGERAGQVGDRLATCVSLTHHLVAVPSAPMVKRAAA